MNAVGEYRQITNFSDSSLGVCDDFGLRQSTFLPVQNIRPFCAANNSYQSLFVDSIDHKAYFSQVECIVIVDRPERNLFVLNAATSMAAEMRRVDEALKGVYALEQGREGRLAARALMIFLEKNFKTKNLAAASALVDRVDLEKLGVHSLIGLVRTTARIKLTLPSWNALYRRSRRAVELKGYSSDRMFVGITPPVPVGGNEESGN